MATDALKKLQVLLKELFQIEDAAELDFGIYRIMGERREEIEKYVNSRLPEVVEAALGSGAAARNAGAGGAAARNAGAVEERRKVSERVRKSFGEAAFSPSGELADTFHDTPLGKEYLALPPESASEEPDALRASIFNHLYSFFSRYYDNGDFISRRRYSKRERYAIPYNGEEVHLHWANADQYYVKSGNFFLDYSFESGGVKVRFEVVSANTEHDNVKEDDSLFIPLAEAASYDAASKTLTVPFEWRPPTAKEKEEFGGKKQDAASARAERDILSKFEGEMEVRKALSDPRPKKNGSPDSKGKPVSVLSHHLGRYAKKNSSDFFVHKDLGGFLSRELDFYIKNEVLDVDDLLSKDGSDSLIARMEAVRAMRGIAHSIIAFLAQIEDFQKRLFEKKKFVVSSHYCLTLDRIPKEFHAEITESDAQYEEWEDLFATSEAENTLENSFDPRSVEWLEANPHLVLDTKHFESDFEDRLLSEIEDLDDVTDGLLINSDNFQALNLIGDRYREQVKCIYIDPPYNTDASEILYKNGYKNSTWLSLIEYRIRLANPIMSADGIISVTIDDFEFHRLYGLLLRTFGSENILGTAVIRSNPSGRSTVKGFSIAHEYGIFASKSGQASIGRLARSEKQIARYKERDDFGLFEWVNFRKHGGADASRAARPRMYYPILASAEGHIRNSLSASFHVISGRIILEEPELNEDVVFPVNAKNEDGGF